MAGPRCCQPIGTNSVLQQVEWYGVEDLAAVAGHEVRFRFHLTSGSLYAFRGAPTQDGASHGYVLGGGSGFVSRADAFG